MDRNRKAILSYNMVRRDLKFAIESLFTKRSTTGKIRFNYRFVDCFL